MEASPQSPLSEEELAGREAALRAGEDAALADLLGHHRDRLRRLVHSRWDRRLQGRVDPEDVLQDAWLEAAQRLAHFRDHPEHSAFVWLRWIVLQTLTDAQRRHLATQARDARREVGFEGGGSAGAGGGAGRGDESGSPGLAARLASALTSPTRAARRAELSDRIETVLRGLSARDQEILTLRHFDELTNQEASEVLGIHKAASTNRYLRALKRLRAALTAAGEGEDTLLGPRAESGRPPDPKASRESVDEAKEVDPRARG